MPILLFLAGLPFQRAQTPCHHIAGGLFLIDEVLDRRTKNGAVEYLVRWVSGGDDNNDDELVSWQRFADLPSGPHARAKEKITEYNAARRTARTD